MTRILTKALIPLLLALLLLGGVAFVFAAEESTLLGDADGNGVVNAADAAAILRHLVRLSTISGQRLINADVNLDGVVNAGDAAAILRSLVRLDTLPPSGPMITWAPPPTPAPTPLLPATPVPTPTTTPIPTNRYGGPAAGDGDREDGSKEPVVQDADPNFDKIYNLFLNRRLPNRSAALPASNQAHKYTVGWCYMSFMGGQNGTSSNNYAPNISAGSLRTIDEPILYRTGSWYLDRDIDDVYASDGTKSTLVSILGYATQNIIITGHNSRSTRAHFHHLHSLQNGAKYYYSQGTLNAANYAYPNIRISIYGMYKWQIWAMYETTEAEATTTFDYNTHPSCGLSSTRSVQDWINYQKARSEVNFGISVTEDDQFMTLYTCGDKYERTDSTNARLYIFLKLMD